MANVLLNFEKNLQAIKLWWWLKQFCHFSPIWKELKRNWDHAREPCSESTSKLNSKIHVWKNPDKWIPRKKCYFIYFSWIKTYPFELKYWKFGRVFLATEFVAERRIDCGNGAQTIFRCRIGTKNMAATHSYSAAPIWSAKKCSIRCWTLETLETFFSECRIPNTEYKKQNTWK